MSRHPIVGVGFVALIVGGIGYGVAQGVDGSRAFVAEKEAAEEARHEAEAKQEKQAEEDARDAQMQKLIRSAVYAAQADDFESAIKILSGGTEQFGDNAGIWLNLGIAQRGAEKWDDAEKSFQKVLALDPEDWDAIAEVATIKKVKGDTDGALTFLEKIPTGQGRMMERLAYDPTFADLDKNERFKALLVKHDAQVLRQSLTQQEPEPAKKPK